MPPSDLNDPEANPRMRLAAGTQGKHLTRALESVPIQRLRALWVAGMQSADLLAPPPRFLRITYQRADRRRHPGLRAIAELIGVSARQIGIPIGLVLRIRACGSIGPLREIAVYLAAVTHGGRLSGHVPSQMRRTFAGAPKPHSSAPRSQWPASAAAVYVRERKSSSRASGS